LKPKCKDQQGERVLIVQAEANDMGDVIYGVIARYAIRAIPASAFIRVGPLEAKERDGHK